MALKLVVEKCLPFDFFSSGSAWDELMGVLTSTTTAFPKISARRVKHLILEAYVATKEVSRAHLTQTNAVECTLECHWFELFLQQQL